jgi:hypothetical protein
MNDDGELITAQRLRDEAAELRKAAAADREAAAYDRGQIEHAKRIIEQTEKSITAREQALKQAGEPAFLARVAAADKALADAQELMSRYNKDWHAGVIAFQQINAREKAERSAA